MDQLSKHQCCCLTAGDGRLIPLDKPDNVEFAGVVKSCVGTKFIGRWSDQAVNILLDAGETVMVTENGRTEINFKKYAKVEKIPGGQIDDLCVLDGFMLNKEVTHPKMSRYVENPRIARLVTWNTPESQTNVEIVGDQVFTKLLQIQKEQAKVCADKIAVKPDVVSTEKGVSDLAKHFRYYRYPASA